MKAKLQLPFNQRTDWVKGLQVNVKRLARTRNCVVNSFELCTFSDMHDSSKVKHCAIGIFPWFGLYTISTCDIVRWIGNPIFCVCKNECSLLCMVGLLLHHLPMK